MSFRFQRRIKIMPGVTLNVGKRGVSTSIGRRGAHITFGQNGVRTTVGIPGTGISYTSLSKPSHAPEAGSREASWPHLSKCPYCGHGMRKRWDRCPACYQVLEQPLPEDAVRCRGCGRVYEGNMLRLCPACGLPAVGYAGGDPAGADGGGARSMRRGTARCVRIAVVRCQMPSG